MANQPTDYYTEEEIADILETALEDEESNSFLLGMTTKKIQELNYQMIKELGLTKKETNAICEKLIDYCFINDLSHLKYGTHLRFISFHHKNTTPPSSLLGRPVIFCKMNENTETGIISLVCKNFGWNQNRHFQINIEDHLIFQKITAEERILLSALDILDEES